MSFETNERIFAIHPDKLDAVFSSALARFGEDVPDGNHTHRTIGAHWDDSNHTRIRAADFPTTITGQPMQDGRLAFAALWQSDLCAAFDAGEFPDVEQLAEWPQQPSIEL